MGKQPAFQFYVRDWLSDPQLRMCSHSTRGIWIDLLCLMWEAPERGKLTGTVEQLARMVSASNGDFALFIEEANCTKFATVTLCNKNVTVINRRMQREEKIRHNTKMRVRKHRSNIACNEDVTLHSSSSSSVLPLNPPQKRNDRSTPIRSEKPSAALVTLTRDGFAEFWKTYPKKIGRAPCESKYEKLMRASPDGDLHKQIMAGLNHLMAHCRKWHEGYAPNPLTFLNQQRWLDEPDHIGRAAITEPKLREETTSCYARSPDEPQGPICPGRKQKHPPNMPRCQLCRRQYPIRSP